MARSRITFFEKLSNATYPELFSLWMVLNIVCAVWYFALATIQSTSAPTHLAELEPLDRLFNSFYFSIITATSLGYGDIVPMGFSKVLAMSQSIVALLVFAVLVTKIVSAKQDTTLEDIHRMTSESIFYNIRHGLFIVRKDIDLLMEKIADGIKLQEQDWELLTTSYLQLQNIIEEIPSLYNGTDLPTHIIDGKRERLLLEATVRTLRRLNTFLQTITKKKITLTADNKNEFKELLHSLDTVFPAWHKRSPARKLPIFADLKGIIKTLHR